MTVYHQPYYKPNKCNDGKQDHCCRPPVDCRPNKVIFKCNNLTGANGISIIALGDSIKPRNIGSISIPELCCFKKPCIKIDFSAMVSFGASIGLGTTVTFRVYKRCGIGEEIEIQSFDLIQGIELTAGSSMPVAFSICDCESCYSDCCLYRVTVEATATASLVSALNVNQGTISVIATDMC